MKTQLIIIPPNYDPMRLVANLRERGIQAELVVATQPPLVLTDVVTVQSSHVEWTKNEYDWSRKV